MLPIHLFGHLRLFLDDTPLTFSVLPKTLPPLAYLLLNRDTPQRRDSVAFKLWMDVPEQAERGALLGQVDEDFLYPERERQRYLLFANLTQLIRLHQEQADYQ